MLLKAGRGGTSLESAVDLIGDVAEHERGIPGLSLAVMRRGQLVLAKGYGFSNLEHKIPALPETVYKIGSISKQFTAAAVMKLVEYGKIRLDDPITVYLPDFPTQGHTVHVRHLLNHTSGIREFFTIPGFDVLESGSPEEYSRDDLIEFFKNEPFQFAPGERWAYSNSNYTLLSVVIERAAGMGFEQYLQEALFQPLGLKSSHSCGARPSTGQFAKGYVLRQGRPEIAPPVNMNTATGDGGLCSSVLDLATWAQALASGRAVHKSSYEEMVASTIVRRGYRPAYGFGLSLVPLDGRRRVGHNGDITGFTGALAHYPADDLTVAVLTNRSQVWPETIEKAVARAALGIATPALKDLKLTHAERQQYVGTFDFGVYPLRVLNEGDRLTFDMGMGRSPYVLLYQGGNAFVAQEDPDAIHLQFSVRGGQADRLVLEMAAMRWYADRVP